MKRKTIPAGKLLLLQNTGKLCIQSLEGTPKNETCKNLDKKTNVRSVQNFVCLPSLFFSLFSFFFLVGVI